MRQNFVSSVKEDISCVFGNECIFRDFRLRCLGNLKEKCSDETCALHTHRK